MTDDTEPESGVADQLAAVVRKPDADCARTALAEAGVYDDDRRVREHDGDALELPVTAPPSPADLPVPLLDVVRQVDPEVRVRGLPDLLRERGFTEAEIAAAPSSWAVVGSVVLVRFGGFERREAVGEALLDLHGEADTVLDRRGIGGEFREPDVAVVAGVGETETVHVEHGTRYALDLSKVMFSPGNEAERVRMGELVAPGERVLDLFAGVGYFTLPMARAGAVVTAVEKNPTAFRYLVENAVLNGVEERVTPYRADCRDVVGSGATGGGTTSSADGEDAGAAAASAGRVVMGYYDAPDYLETGLAALEPGGVLHLHAAVPEALLWDRPVSRLEEAAGAAGREVAVLNRRTVKTHSEGVRHVVVDARVG